MAASRIWLGYVVCCRVRESLGVCFYYITFELQEGGTSSVPCYGMLRSEGYYTVHVMTCYIWHAPARSLGLGGWREMRGV